MLREVDSSSPSSPAAAIAPAWTSTPGIGTAGHQKLNIEQISFQKGLEHVLNLAGYPWNQFDSGTRYHVGELSRYGATDERVDPQLSKSHRLAGKEGFADVDLKPGVLTSFSHVNQQ